MVTAVSRWGNGHAVRLSKTVMSQAHIFPNDTLNIEASENCIVLRKVPKTKAERFMELFGYYKGDWSCKEIDTGNELGKEIAE